MRCQRCGFELEPGQTFCSMCGTEQAKAMRKKKKKIKSILGVIKITSNNHLKMWINFGLMILMFTWMYLGYRGTKIFYPYICLGILLMGYILIQCLIPYKNPNASKSKKYKMSIKVCFGLMLILMLVMLFDTGFLDLVKKI